MIGKTLRFLAPKLFVIISLALAVWIGSAAFREMDRGKRIQEEIASLQSDAQKTQKENALLREKIDYLQTDEFQAQEARNKLNYQSPDEKVVVVNTVVHEAVAEKPDNEASSPSKAQDFLPNYEKWWQQFFAV